MTSVHVKVSETGRLSLPAELRRATGLERGGDVVIELDGRDLRIRTVRQVVEQAQSLTARLLAGSADATVEHFLAARRADAGKE
jgi:bifunctional DNA-binding transcriptional regulator/antitoxin component of YhaV-PrlF toxin-antitoxin module